MDLQCRVEHSERDWLWEKAELLRRFDSERRDWESQLRDMQRKIETLYCEVRTRREAAGPESLVDTGSLLWDGGNDVLLRLSAPGSGSMESSARSNQSHAGLGDRTGQSEPPKQPPLPGYYRRSAADGEVNGGRSGEPRTRGPRAHQGAPEAVESGPRGKASTGGNATNEETRLRVELGYGSEKKRNTTALNAALKEIARVSEELCSYQEEIRRKAEKHDKRNGPESCVEGQKKPSERSGNPGAGPAQPLCDFSQIYRDLRALEREDWTVPSPADTWAASGEGTPASTVDRDFPEADGSDGNEAPAVPPRTTSWGLGGPAQPETELHIPEAPAAAGGRCHSPCASVGRPCNSPSIVRKFEAMLQENEGKVLAGRPAAPCSAPASSGCNLGCCHNRRPSGDAGRPAPGAAVQKSLPELDVGTAGKERNPEGPRAPSHAAKERPTAGSLLPPALETPPAACPAPPQSSRRNVLLEQKTAEFNRTLFQAEMGRGVPERDGPIPADAPPPAGSSAGGARARGAVGEGVRLHTERNSNPRPQSAGVTSDGVSAIPKAAPAATATPACDPPSQNPQVRLRRTSGDARGQGVKGQRDPAAAPPELSLRSSLTVLSEVSVVTTRAQRPEPKAPSPDNTCGPKRGCADPVSGGPVSPGNARPGRGPAGPGPAAERSPRQKVRPARDGSSPRRPAGRTRTTPEPDPRGKQGGKATAASPSDARRPGAGRVMSDHPWKPLTLAAYPRPEGSRSNYGAVERILKSYGERAEWARDNQTASAPDLSPKPPQEAEEEEEETEEEEEEEEEEEGIDMSERMMMDTDALHSSPVARHTRYSHASHTTHTHPTFSQVSNSSVGGKEIQLNIQDGDTSAAPPAASTPSPRPARRNFSRPACPANRRLPSRWAGRSLSSSSSSSSSSSTFSSPAPSFAPVAPPSTPLPLHKRHPPSFVFSHAFHTEAIII